MSWNLPPGCTDKDVDDAAPHGEAVQCDNCGRMFDPEDEDCFIGWHSSYGDCCQCGECRQKVWAENANFPFSGSF